MNKFFGGLLMGIGALIAGTTGLCTGVFLFEGLTQRGGELNMSWVLPLLVGGIPCGLGALLMFGGWQLWKSR